MAEFWQDIPFDKLQIKLRWTFLHHRFDRRGPFRSYYSLFWLILDGFRVIELEGEQLQLHKGSLLILPPLTTFSIRSGEQGEQCQHLTWVGDVRVGAFHLVEQYAFPRLMKLAPEESVSLEQAWRRAVEGSEIYANMLSGKIGAFESAPEYMSMQSRQWEWLAELCRVVRSKIELKSVSIDNRIEDTCQFIQRNLAEKLTVEALAARLYMSESHFRSLFKVNTGLAPAVYIRKCRIGLAQNLILAGDGSLTDISALAGFASQSEFCRVFRQEEGMSPLQYKKKFVYV